MEIKAKDMCPRCKYCLGMTPQGMYSCGKANDGSELNIGIDVILNCANFEWKDGKVEGKVGDFCLKCKNCKAVTRMHDGKNASIRIIEVECEDPYDGMVKTLDVDSDICCSMFEPKKEKEPFNLNMSRKQLESKILDLFEEKNRLNGIINILEKEKSNHLKGIERLKKSQEKLQNQVKNLQTTNEESYKREEKLEDKVHKLERRLLEENKRFDRLDTEFLIPLSRVLYPREAKICKPYSEVINDIKDLKVYADENGQMYKELQEWREKCISRGNDIDHLLSENKEKDKKIGELESRKEECEKKYRDEISKLQNIVTEKEVEIKYLRKDNARLNKDISWGNMIAEKNTELNQTISDQEITIKALLITIKEMCKEENENA